MSGNAGAVYFNEFDRYPAAWLRNLYPAATVDERSIADVGSTDVAGFARAHFFGGIGGWEYALDLAGWPAGREVWTGSCPCQPFSAAGRGLGAADPRHLWPEFYRLIAECRPSVVFGEQVGGAAGRAWLAAVRADLEAIGYAVGAADLCAAGVGAPHIRQRLYWVANADGGHYDGSRDFGAAGRDELADRGGLADALHTKRRSVNVDRQDGCDGPDDGRPQAYGEPGARGQVHGVADADGNLGRQGGQNARGRGARSDAVERPGPGRDGMPFGLGNADGAGREARDGIAGGDSARPERASMPGAWGDAEWLPCADGRARPAQPGVRPLAHGIPARASKLRAYGNAIVPQVAAVFIRAFMDCEVTA